MTNMNPNEGFAHFGIVTATVCLPTYFLIAVINQPEQFEITVAFLGYPFVWLSTGFQHSSDRAKKYRDRYMHRKKEEEPKPVLTRANTMASLDFRLSREEMNRERALSVVGTQQEMLELPKTGNGNAQRPALPERESTIRFEMPTYRRSTMAHHELIPEPSPNTSVPELEKRMTEPVQGRLTVTQRMERNREARSQPAPTKTLLRRFTSQSKGEAQKSPV